LNALLSFWMWLEIALVVIVGFFIQVLLWVFTWPFDRNRYVAGRFFRSLGILIARISPFWDFRVVGPVGTLAPRTVVVSNHESQADPFLISHLPWEMKWLAKAVLFRMPFVGWSMRLAGDVPVHRGVTESAKGAMQQCAQWLERGMPVMIFPEGTRSTGKELLPFKDGAFRLAIEAGADVLPIAVAGTRRALPKHSWRFQRVEAWVCVGQPIPTRGLTLADVGTLADRARQQVHAMRETLLSRARVTP
jgi:1-acyl-sn-glycerol-3-phosphate acyltransferase